MTYGEEDYYDEDGIDYLEDELWAARAEIRALKAENERLWDLLDFYDINEYEALEY